MPKKGTPSEQEAKQSELPVFLLEMIHTLETIPIEEVFVTMANIGVQAPEGEVGLVINILALETVLKTRFPEVPEGQEKPHFQVYLESVLGTHKRHLDELRRIHTGNERKRRD